MRGRGGQSIFTDCQDITQFKSKLIDSLVFLTSPTGWHDIRTTLMPRDRIFAAFDKNLSGIPEELIEIARLSFEEKRLLYIPDTKGHEMFCTGDEECNSLTVYTAVVEGFDLDREKIAQLAYPSLVFVPLDMEPLEKEKEAVGVAVVCGLKPNFLDPWIDLEALRWLGQHAGKILQKIKLV